MNREIWKKFGKLSFENRTKIVKFIREESSEKLSNIQIIEKIIQMDQKEWEEILSS